MGRPALLQPQIGRTDAQRRPSRHARGTLHRHARALGGLHAEPLRNPDRPLLLANPPETGRAERLRSRPDRAGPAHGSGDAALAGVLHGGHREMASRTGRPAQDGLCPTAAPRSHRSRLRRLLRDPGVARHGAVPLLPQRSSGGAAHGADRRVECAARRLLEGGRAGSGVPASGSSADHHAASGGYHR